jgi:hypothetical protein
VPVFFISIKTNPAKEPPKMNLCSNKCSWMWHIQSATFDQAQT